MSSSLSVSFRVFTSVFLFILTRRNRDLSAATSPSVRPAGPSAFAGPRSSPALMFPRAADLWVASSEASSRLAHARVTRDCYQGCPRFDPLTPRASAHRVIFMASPTSLPGLLPGLPRVTADATLRATCGGPGSRSKAIPKSDRGLDLSLGCSFWNLAGGSVPWANVCFSVVESSAFESGPGVSTRGAAMWILF